MNAVKGSKQRHMKVVPHRPLRNGLLAVVAVAVVIAAIVGSYRFGKWQGMGRQASALAERDQLRVALNQEQTNNSRLRQKVTNLSVASKVDRQANEDVRTEVMKQRKKITSLEADISFYRGLMAPGDDKKGLSLGEVNIVETNIPRHYSFKVVVQQLTAHHRVLSGDLQVDVIGRLNGEIVHMPLYKLSDSINEQHIKLRFKYFQNVTGELVLPEGFEPKKVKLVAEADGHHADKVEKSYGWLVQDI